MRLVRKMGFCLSTARRQTLIFPMLLAFGADPTIPTIRVPERGYAKSVDPNVPYDVIIDHSGLPPIPLGGPAVYPIHAASGVGYGQGYAGNSHRHVPDGWLRTVKFLVEELHIDVTTRDHNGYKAVHHAAPNSILNAKSVSLRVGKADTKMLAML